MILTDWKRGETSPTITHFSANKNGVLDLFSLEGPDDGTALIYDRETRTWVTTEISDRWLTSVVAV
mgnify:FL=1